MGGIFLFLLINHHHKKHSTDYQLISAIITTMVAGSVPDRYFNIRMTHAGFLSFFIWMAAMLLITSAYKSNLLASLIVVEYEKPLDTYQEILDRGVTLATFNGAIMSEIMKNSHRPVMREILDVAVAKRGGSYKGKVPKHLLDGIEQGRAAIQTADINMIGQRHKLRFASDFLEKVPAGFFLKINHPYMDTYNIMLMRLIESGVFHQQWNYLWKIRIYTVCSDFHIRLGI